MTSFAEHSKKWSQCGRCALCEHRKRVCLTRGRYGPDGRWALRLPAPIVFVGEAPGVSEDSSGVPFDGPAGHLLESIAESAGAFDHECAFTNTIGCIPLSDGEKLGKPPDFALKACLPRLREFFALARPKLIVAVGEVADKWMARHVTDLGIEGIATVAITHPAAILRGPSASRGLTIRRCELVLRKSVAEVFGAPRPQVGLFD